MPEKISPKIEKPQETTNLQSLELKANLNPEQKSYLDKLKTKAGKILGNKTENEFLAKEKDIKQLKKYKETLQEILQFLKTKEMHGSEMERIFTPEQYESKIEVLKETGVLRQFENGEWGIIDILGQERPVPSYEEIIKRMEAKSEILEKKREQGFTELLLVPIGTPLSFLIDRTRDMIVKKHKEGKLLGTDGTKLELDENQPIYVADEYQDADVKGDLVYYPQKFDKLNHVSKTKQELLSDWPASRSSESVGWEIMLIEDLPDLPAEGKGKEIADRKQFAANLSPEQYLQTIQTDEQYAGEEFTTPEAQLIYFMEYLQRNNQVIDDWKGQGKVCWNAGAYFKEKGAVPLGVWYRNSKRFRLGCDSPDDRIGYGGVRASVKF